MTKTGQVHFSEKWERTQFSRPTYDPHALLENHRQHISNRFVVADGNDEQIRKVGGHQQPEGGVAEAAELPEVEDDQRHYRDHGRHCQLHQRDARQVALVGHDGGDAEHARQAKRQHEENRGHRRVGLGPPSHRGTRTAVPGIAPSALNPGYGVDGSWRSRVSAAGLNPGYGAG